MQEENKPSKPIKPEVKTQAGGKPMGIVPYIKTMNRLYGSSNVDEFGNEERATDRIQEQDRQQKAKPKGSDFYYNAAENAMELKSDPSPHRPTVQVAKKTDPTAGAVYTSKLDQVAYPIPGTAPAEKKAITDAEIQKRIDKSRGPSDWDLIKMTAKKPSEKQEVRRIVNEQYLKNPQSLSKDDWKYVDRKLIKPVKIFSNSDPSTFLSNESQRRALLTPEKFTKPPQYPEVKLVPVIDHSILRDTAADKARVAALEKMRVYAFTPRPDPDAVKGIGSFKNTIGRKLRAENSVRDWKKRNQTIYKG